MKRIIYVMIFLFCAATCFGQSSNSDGYDGFSWGATVEQVKAKYPDLINQTKNEDKMKNEAVYYYSKSSDFIRIFRFFDGKLYFGRTAYVDVDSATVNAVATKVKDLYGYSDYSNESSEATYTSTNFYWYVSSNLTVMLELRSNYNQFGRYTSSTILLTNVNPVTVSEVEEYSFNNKLGNIEL